MQGQCKPSTESSLFVEVQPVLAVFNRKVTNNFRYAYQLEHHKTAVPPYYIYGTDVLTAVNRANVNVSSDRHLWHDFVRRYNLYLDKVTTVFIDFERISC